MTIDHRQGALTDRASRTQECDPNCHYQPPLRIQRSVARYQYAIGNAKKRASKRSRIPPCPGIRFPESFTPASLLRSDSTRSPICAAEAMSAPPIAPPQNPVGSPAWSAWISVESDAPPVTPPLVPASDPSLLL